MRYKLEEQRLCWTVLYMRYDIMSFVCFMTLQSGGGVAQLVAKPWFD